MAQHRVGYTPLAPGTGYLCMMGEAVPSTNKDTRIREAEFTAMLVLDQCAPLLRIGVQPQNEGCYAVSIESSFSLGEWTQHVMLDVGTAAVHQPGSSAPSNITGTMADCSTRSTSTAVWELRQMQLVARIPTRGPSSVMINAERSVSPFTSQIVLEGMVQRPGKSADRITYLRCGQLEATQSHHMYTTVWTDLSSSSVNTNDAQQQQTGAVVWDSQVHDETGSTLGPGSMNISGLNELCAACVESILPLLYCATGSTIPATVLRAVQVGAGGTVCVVDRAAWQQKSYRKAGSWGLAKSVNAERGQLLHCACVEDAATCLTTLVTSHADEPQLVLRGYTMQQGLRLSATTKKGALGCPVELALHSRGALSSLSVQPQSAQPDVMLEVKAVGLNFRDVLNVLGMYPGDPGPPGGDCAGIACHEHAAHVGTAVFGLGFGSLRSYAATDPRLLAVMPGQWSDEESSAMPTVWMTVWMCLEELTGIHQGSDVLVQAATGGVGLVAVQCAHRTQARVCATAGRAEKQAFMRGRGVCMVSTTRDGTVFAVETDMMLGGDSKFRVVLNSLSHDEYIPRAAWLLGDGGQFVEIGKRGIWNRAQMAARQHVRYNVVAMDSQCSLDPAWQQDALHGLSTRVTAVLQEVRPLPLHVFELRTEGLEAFRVLQRASHVGKVAISTPDGTSIWTAGSDGNHFTASGGTGGLGLLVGQWLMKCNGSRLVLLSRSGATANGAEQYWNCLAGRERASVQVQLSDVRMHQEVLKMVECSDSGATGTVHSSGVLVDALLPNQTQSGLQQVWGPKAHAAWSLHQANPDHELQMFALFSSVSALIGGAGQANYAAANACLDRLARLRQEQGLAGTSVQWGAWTGAGMAIESGVLGGLEQQGIGAVTAQQGLCALELAVSGVVGSAVVGMAPVQWTVLLGLMGGEVPRFLTGFENRVQQQLAEGVVSDATGFVASLAGHDDEMLQEAVQAMMLSKVHVAAGVSVDAHDTLKESGVDSMAATELRVLLQRELGDAVKLPSTLIFEYPTVNAIAEFTAGQLATAFTQEETPPVKIGEAVVHIERGPGQVVEIDSEGRICVEFEDEEVHRYKPHSWHKLFHTTSTQSISSHISLASMQNLVAGEQSALATIAVAGIACKLGGGTRTLAALWSSLLEQTCCITHSPPHRWQQACKVSPTAVRCGAFLSSDELQPAFPHPKMMLLDTHTHLLLETSLQALADAGYTQANVRSAQLGMFTASQPSDFIIPIAAFNVARSVASVLGISGPHQNNDVACSSGYLAAHHALQAMRSNTCGEAVTAGASLLLKPDTSLLLYNMRVLSPSGNMRPLDMAADGMVWGEACCALVLRRHTSSSQERSLALLAASAANCNNALSPDGFTDSDRIQRVAQDARALGDVAPGELVAIHPHAMGNSASDVPELIGLLAALTQTVLVGHKTSYGHSVCASGIVSIIVSALVLQHNTVPRITNVTRPLRNREVDLQDTERMLLPIARAVSLVPQDGVTKLGVNGTSLSGDNVHIILEHQPGINHLHLETTKNEDDASKEASLSQLNASIFQAQKQLLSLPRRCRKALKEQLLPCASPAPRS